MSRESLLGTRIQIGGALPHNAEQKIGTSLAEPLNFLESTTHH